MMHQPMYKSFIVARSKTDSDATVRLQSDGALRGLKNRSSISSQLIHPNQSFEIPSGSCVLFHFDDAPAIEALKRARERTAQFTAACFGSDIYQFRRYLPSYDVADLYIMPTEIHRQVLASQFYKPVYCLPECIDPITEVKQGSPPSFPSKRSKRMLWFGYPDSFNKAMASLVPVLKMHRKSANISDFSLILDEQEFLNEYKLPTIPFRKESFRSDAASFDYCILSHFSLDLRLNSYIKSPNKLVTALMIGLIPIASNTPNYHAILREFGLERFLFDSPSGLDRLLRSLDPQSDSQEIARSGIVEALAERYSEARLAENLLAILSEFEACDKLSQLNLKPPILPAPSAKPVVSFSEHYRDLFPSVWRGAQRRMRRMRLQGGK